MAQNDPGQQTKISQRPAEKPVPESAARTLLPTDDVTKTPGPGIAATPSDQSKPYR